MSSGKCCYSCGFGRATATQTEMDMGSALHLLGRHNGFRRTRGGEMKRKEIYPADKNKRLLLGSLKEL